jgi:hypothetical protein
VNRVRSGADSDGLALICASTQGLPHGKDAGHVHRRNDSYEAALVEDEDALVDGRSQALYERREILLWPRARNL